MAWRRILCSRRSQPCRDRTARHRYMAAIHLHESLQQLRAQPVPQPGSGVAGWAGLVMARKTGWVVDGMGCQQGHLARF